MTNPTHPLIMRLRRTARPRRASDGAALTRFAQNHDSEAFAQLVERFGPMVQGVCKRVLGDTPDADDAYQATFVVLVRKARTVRPPEAVGSWLFAVAHRTAVYARTVMNRRSVKYRPLDREPANEPPRTPEVLAALDTELAGLPDKYRDAVVLCELHGKSLKEAADALAVPVGTLASRLARGRQLLADRLKGKGFAVSAATISGMLAAGGMVKAVPEFNPLAVEAGSTQLADGVMKMALLSKLKLTTAGVLGALVAIAFAIGLLPGSAAPVANAAPVPKVDDKLSEKKAKEFNELWHELSDWRSNSSWAALGFLKNPMTTVAYFRTKLKPLKLEEKEAKQLIARLADDKDDVWKVAEAELMYRHPILAMKLPDIWVEAKTPEHKARLAIVLLSGMIKRRDDCEFELLEEPGDATFPFKMQCKYPIPQFGNLPPGARATDTCPVPDVISKLNNHDVWHRADRAALILEHLGTPDAVKLLEEMATGHADANPTKTAKEALARLKKK